MDPGKRTPSVKGNVLSSSSSTTFTQSFRNLKKENLAGVIFGCTDSTMKECLSKQLFGLPGQHFTYVKNIEPGLMLFLFNYNKRELHGIFGAASPGQMNYDPYGWTSNGSQKTQFPSQVWVHVQKKCRPLVETQFASIIKDNYYTSSRFWFELDHVQVSQLISLFSNQVVSVTPSTSAFRNTGNTGSWQIVNHHKPKFDARDNERTANSRSSNLSNGHSSPKSPPSCHDGAHLIEVDETQEIYERSEKLSTAGLFESFPEIEVPEPANMSATQADGDGSQKTETIQVEDNSDNSMVMQDLLKAFERAHVQEISQMKQRLILESQVFNTLRQQHGESYYEYMKTKLVAVAGNLSEPKLGISNLDLAREIENEVVAIINIGGSTNWNERYDVALEVNVKGLTRFLNYALQWKKLAAFLYVSTVTVAFVGRGREGVFLEKPVYMPEEDGESKFGRPIDIDAELKLVSEFANHVPTNELSTRMTQLGIERAKIHGFTNTYLMTKTMGEMVITKCLKGKLSAIIIRPSFVECSLKEPYPGWTEGYRFLQI